MAYNGRRPDYSNSLVNLLSSIQQGFGVRNPIYSPLSTLQSEELTEARNIVLWLIDGFAYQFVRQHCPNLLASMRAPILSVFPSSTAPAITSLMTASAPQQHAVTGWFMLLRELGAITAILPMRTRAGRSVRRNRAKTVQQLIGASPVFSQLSAVSAAECHLVINHELRDSMYTQVSAGTAQRHGYHGLTECIECIRKLTQGSQARQFIYAYWPAFDALAHAHGMASNQASAHAAELEEAICELAATLRGSDTLLIVSADHGLIDCPDEHLVVLNQHPELLKCLRYPLCGEPRAAYAYIRPQRQRLFTEYLDAELSAEISWFPAAELIEQGWFGLGAPEPSLVARIGDFILLPTDDRIVIDRLDTEPPWRLIGVHGGLSDDEMQVPLLVAQC